MAVCQGIESSIAVSFFHFKYLYKYLHGFFIFTMSVVLNKSRNSVVYIAPIKVPIFYNICTTA